MFFGLCSIVLFRKIEPWFYREQQADALNCWDRSRIVIFFQIDATIEIQLEYNWLLSRVYTVHGQWIDMIKTASRTTLFVNFVAFFT